MRPVHTLLLTAALMLATTASPAMAGRLHSSRYAAIEPALPDGVVIRVFDGRDAYPDYAPNRLSSVLPESRRLNMTSAVGRMPECRRLSLTAHRPNGFRIYRRSRLR